MFGRVCASALVIEMRRALKIILVLPLVYTLIFGGLFYKNLVTGVPVLVVNLDDGANSQKLLRDFYDTPEIEVIEVSGGAAELEMQLWESGAVGAVVVPKDYSQKISRGESTAVELILDNTNTILGGVATRAVQSVISTQNAETLATNRIAAGWDLYEAQTAFLTLNTRIFYNPTGGYSDFFLTVLILHSLQIAAVFSIAPAITQEKLSTGKVNLGAKFLIFTLFEVAVVAICLAVGIKFFGLICRGDFWEILAIVAAYAFSITGFAVCVGAWNSVPYLAVVSTVAYVMPSILFTGAIWPLYSMDKISAFFSYVMPICYVADDLRNLFLKGTAYGWEWHALTSIVFGGVFLCAGYIGLKLKGGRTDVADIQPRIKTAD